MLSNLTKITCVICRRRFSVNACATGAYLSHSFCLIEHESPFPPATQEIRSKSLRRIIKTITIVQNLPSTQEKASESLRRDKMPSRHSVVTQYTSIVTRNPANLSARTAALSANTPADSSRQAAQLSPGAALPALCLFLAALM